MGTDAIVTKVRDKLDRAFDKTRLELDRVEILAAGLAAFNVPVPGYEPMFHHLRPSSLAKHELPAD